MLGVERTPPGRFARRIGVLLLVVAVCRLAGASYAGLTHNRGDFYATMPGAYAQTLNPDLWNSPDLQLSDGYQRAVYLYGPTQYLTIAPLVLLDSYEAIATVLLCFYLPLIALSAYVMWRAFRPDTALPRHTAVAVLASTFLFMPMLQAYGQREFEIVIVFLMVCAVSALVRSRPALGGALIGYAAWFKFFPIAFLAYFALRGWHRAVAAFLVVSAALLTVTHITLGLQRFGTVVELASVEAFASIAPQAFCEAWSQPETRHHAVANTTRVSVRWAFCSLADRWTWLDPQMLVFTTLIVVLGTFAVGYWRLRHAILDSDDERWRRTLEFSLVATVPWLFSHAHYYYLVFAIIPLNALLVRYLDILARDGTSTRLWVWVAAYGLLSAFVVPSSVLSRAFDVDFWQLYMRYNVSFYGELLLLGIVLWEYVTITTPGYAPARSRATLGGQLVDAR